MEDENPVHQGEILMILVKRSGKEGREVANKLGITPAYLSMMFKKKALTKRKRMEIAQYFGVDESVFESGIGYNLPNTPSVAEEGRQEMYAELQRLQSENKRLAAALLREQGITDDLRAMLRQFLGESGEKDAPAQP